MRKDITFYEDYGEHYSDEQIEQILLADERFDKNYNYIIVEFWDDWDKRKGVYIID